MSEDMGSVTPLASPSVVSPSPANEPATPSTGGKEWLIWSEKWGAWYRPDSDGYTGEIGWAGRFTLTEARQMVGRGTTRMLHLSEVRQGVENRLEEMDRRASPLRELLALIDSVKGVATTPESTREGTKGVSPDPTKPNTSQHLIDRGRVEP